MYRNVKKQAFQVMLCK